MGKLLEWWKRQYSPYQPGPMAHVYADHIHQKLDLIIKELEDIKKKLEDIDRAFDRKGPKD